MRYKLTRQELHKAKASDYKEGDIVQVGKYDIYIKYGQHDTPALCSRVEKDWVKIGCTPGADRPYYIDDFINR
jgi:hypothetical protein